MYKRTLSPLILQTIQYFAFSAPSLPSLDYSTSKLTDQVDAHSITIHYSSYISLFQHDLICKGKGGLDLKPHT